MFWTRFIELCNEAGKSPNAVAAACGVKSSGTVTGWSKGSVPRSPILHKMADYFHVSVDYLLGNVNDPFFYLDNRRILQEINSYGDEENKTPALSDRDRRDVAHEVDKIMVDLAESGELMFDGVPMSDEARAAMAAAMRIGLEEARRRNKVTYTPKKYKKG